MKIPTFNPPCNVDDARAQADTHIAKLEESLRKLMEERNALCYAVRLSPDILTQIFLYVISDIYEKNMTPIHQLYLPHVCRYWYRVASYSQQYWRYQPLRLDGKRRFQAPHLVERAGGRPLHIWGNVFMRSCWDLSTCDPISQHLTQAESVQISMRPKEHPWDLVDPLAPPYLATFLKKKAPNLKVLSLLKDRMYDPFSIGDDIFGGETPNLSYLSLTNFLWTWRAPLFPPTLTSLALVGPVVWSEECAQTLRRLPLLQFLGLRDTTSSDEQAPIEVVLPSNRSPSVKLDHLKVLRLEGGPVDTGMARLSLELDVPSSTISSIMSRHLLFRRENDSRGAYPELAPLLSFYQRYLESRRRDPIFAGVLHIRPEFDDSSDANFRLWFTQERIGDIDDFGKLGGVADLYLALDSFDDPQDSSKEPVVSYVEAIVSTVISQLPLSSVHTLYLEDIPSISDTEKAFQGLTGVQTLIIEGGDATRILRDLIIALPRDKSSQKKTRSEEGILLPALSNVVLASVSFSSGSGDVLTFVANRSRLKHAVPTLKLSKCKHVSPRWLQKLRRYVAKVEWDGLGAGAGAVARA
ncbi:hypothetical protein NLI96_g929 [Meripilus lineatus]|uniref:F-box domain-containing protein n=1 Tax=Meripilus lineatus TaxID=2056292 RepID=A0AAD5VBS4_9APHY|nr:hypothetical protein NLI96_g929 [Physisporinus lineatus]